VGMRCIQKEHDSGNGSHWQKTSQNGLEIEAIVRWSDFNKILIEGNKTSID